MNVEKLVIFQGNPEGRRNLVKWLRKGMEFKTQDVRKCAFEVRPSANGADPEVRGGILQMILLGMCKKRGKTTQQVIAEALLIWEARRRDGLDNPTGLAEVFRVAPTLTKRLDELYTSRKFEMPLTQDEILRLLRGRTIKRALRSAAA